MEGRFLDDVLNLEHPEQVKAVLHPLRGEMLKALARGPATPSEVARAIGIPANKAHYHMNVLEKAGLVRLAETRAVGSVTEKYYERVAQRFQYEVRNDPSRASAALPMVEKQLAGLVADLKASIARGEAASPDAFLRIGHMAPGDKAMATVEEAWAELRKAVDSAGELHPDQKFRLVMAWVPITEEE
jgi:DNA-binding transcriptional ArsR family regulator